MATARPKRYVMFMIRSFTGDAQCYIHCYPQQKWHYHFNGNNAEMTYKNFDLSIPKADFDKFFVEVE